MFRKTSLHAPTNEIASWSVLLGLIAVIMTLALRLTPHQTAPQQSPVAEPEKPASWNFMVPLRAVAEQLDASVKFDDRTQRIVVERGLRVVELTVGSRLVRVNGRPLLLDIPVFTVGGVADVPLAFLGEALDVGVQWLDTSQTILIRSRGSDNEPPAPRPPAGDGQPARTSQIDNPRIVVRNGGRDRAIAETVPVIRYASADLRADFEESRRLANAIRAFRAARGCYPVPSGLDVGADAMPKGLGPYLRGPWPTNQLYQTTDGRLHWVTGAGSTVFNVRVGAKAVYNAYGSDAFEKIVDHRRERLCR